MDSSKQSYNLELLSFIAPELYKGLKATNNLKTKIHIIAFFHYDVSPTVDVDVILGKIFSNKNDLQRLEKCNEELLIGNYKEKKAYRIVFCMKKKIRIF
ncbi:hypothetical protein AT251_11255 [Enterovibrio nigricans]|nr:hypothetical protein [Enterovibrio nigricans]PKF50464.1 hypothetical protein AT251_11255 [Enterovibrio nigricans]